MDLNLPKKRIIQNNAAAWKRALSFIVDLIIINIVIAGPFRKVIASKFSISGSFMENYIALEKNPALLSSLVPIFSVIFFLIYVYFVIFEYKMRQTPGKMLFSQKLIGKSKKENISLLKIMARNLAAFPIFPFSLLWIIDPLYLAVSGNRLTDKLTSTRYVEEISL